MKKAFSVMTVVLFFAIISFFTAFSIFGQKRDFSVKENRALQMLPEFPIDSLFDESFHEEYSYFQEQYDEYLSDQFEFRDFWVTAKTRIMIALGKKDMNGVYLGKDGYIIEKYEESDFDDEMVKYNSDTISSFLNWVSDEWGISSFISFVPSKGTVLSNRLPKYAKAYDTSYVKEDVESNLNVGVKSVDLLSSLTLHQEEYIYFRTDHHWTSLGAYYAYESLSKEMGFSPIPIEDFESKEVCSDFFGSSYDKIQLGTDGDTIIEYTPKVNVKVDYHGEMEKSNSLFAPEMLSGKNKYEYFLGGNFARVDIKTNAESDETLLVIKDSYTNAVIPFLANHYKKIILIDLRFYNGDIFELIDFDISKVLVLLNTEKFMQDQNLPKLEYVDESEYIDQEEEAEQERILAELED